MTRGFIKSLTTIVCATSCALALVTAPSLAQAASKMSRVPKISANKVKENAVSRTVDIPLGKARIIDLPVSVRDVLLADPTIAQLVIRTPRKIYLIGSRLGTTNAFFFDAFGREIFRAEISVNADFSAAERALKALLPNADITVRGSSNNLFLTGNVRSAQISAQAVDIASRFVDNAAGVVNLLQILEDQQVLLQVKIAEVSRRILKEIGINLLDVFTGALNVLTANSLTFQFATGGTGSTGAFGVGSAVYTSGSGDQLAATIRALEQNGLVRTLAEPNLTAISGESASFLAGGSFPVPVGQSDGRVSITMMSFGVSLSFTPVVIDAGRISLRISTEVSDRDVSIGFTLPDGSTVPGTRIRRAETTVELPSGGTMMMAGLFQQDVSTTISGVPGLKDIPIFGALFRSNALDQIERELVVIITATLIRPIAKRNNVVLPTDGLASPSDYDLFAMGRIQKTYTGGGSASLARDIKGPIGYIVQ